nr:uncharacterized protein LOC106684319 [Halyomorpha halys]
MYFKMFTKNRCYWLQIFFVVFLKFVVVFCQRPTWNFDLNAASLYEGVMNSNYFVMFYNQRCPSCDSFKHVMELLAEQYNPYKLKVKIGMVDCGLEKWLCENVTESYPTFVYFKRGIWVPWLYMYDKDLASFQKFINKYLMGESNTLNEPSSELGGTISFPIPDYINKGVAGSGHGMSFPNQPLSKGQQHPQHDPINDLAKMPTNTINSFRLRRYRRPKYIESWLRPRNKDSE